jgi:hypothetical protein
MSTPSSSALLKLAAQAHPELYRPPAMCAVCAKPNAGRSGEMAASGRLPRSRHRKPRLPPRAV